MTAVDINGTMVSMDDPCAVANALRTIEIQIAAGGGVAMTRFGDDEVRWHAANLGRLRELIDRYDRACAIASGKRRRFAKSIRFVG